MSKQLGPAFTGPTPIPVAAWNGNGIRPSFGSNKQLIIEQPDETEIQDEDSLAALVGRKSNGLNRGTEAENRLNAPMSYHQSQNEYLF